VRHREIDDEVTAHSRCYLLFGNRTWNIREMKIVDQGTRTIPCQSVPTIFPVSMSTKTSFSPSFGVWISTT
jgi:hypothetical protein